MLATREWATHGDEEAVFLDKRALTALLDTAYGAASTCCYPDNSLARARVLQCWIGLRSFLARAAGPRVVWMRSAEEAGDDR